MRAPGIARCKDRLAMVCSLMLIFSAAGAILKADEQAPLSDQAPKARRLNQMRERAMRATVRVISDEASATATDEKPVAVKLEEQPLFRYDDQPRGFRDGTLWMWTAGGRPIAFGKIEDWRGEQGLTWITCFASLSPGLIESSWQSGPKWTARKPGLQFRVFEGFDPPQATESGRLRQFKDLADRFSISLQKYQSDSQELRRLARPLHRYHLPDSNVDDAVIFGWTSDGTNPDVAFAVELRTSGNKKEWLYAMTGMTADKVTLKLDDVVVGSKDYTPVTGDDTVRWFMEKNTDPID